MKFEAINNDLFTVLTIDGTPVRVRALPMSDAVAWAALATNAMRKIDQVSDYGEMREAFVEITQVLSEYPGIDAALLEKASTEQITSAVEALLEVNDPFVQRRKRREKDEEKGLDLLTKLPAETARVILQQHMESLSVQSPQNSA